MTSRFGTLLVRAITAHVLNTRARVVLCSIKQPEIVKSPGLYGAIRSTAAISGPPSSHGEEVDGRQFRR